MTRCAIHRIRREELAGALAADRRLTARPDHYYEPAERD